MPDPRVLHWDGCRNVRDLGGLPRPGGRWTAYGAVARADDVARLSEAGWRSLAAYGAGRVVDLRCDDERADDPPRACTAELVLAPIPPGGEDDPRWREFAAIEAAAAGEVAALRDVYLAFLERYPAAFAAALAAIADAPRGAVVVHCRAGQDRTGLIAALLLRLVDVEPGDVAADFALSGTPGPVMAGVLRELDTRHGGAEGYALAAGVTPQQVRRLRERLAP